jgi:signal transduction histidine kinase/DNA-binding response OmpR family regulator
MHGGQDNFPMKSIQPILKGVKGKVIAAFVLACLAIVAALAITSYSFKGLLATVDKLAQPNDKLTTLNNLFQRVTQLDQLQRATAIRNPDKKYASLLRESKPLIMTIDTLRALPWQDETQLDRLDQMEKILHKRDELLLSYFRLKSEFVQSKNFSEQLDSLASIITWSQANRDTSVTTTERRTVTTTYPMQPEKDDRSFWEKTFGSKKKKDEPEETRIEVQEEFRVKVDTIFTAQLDSAIAAVGRLMKNIEEGHRTQSQQMIQRELELVSANTNLINQLVGNLREVEHEERIVEKANNEQAVLLVNKSIERIGIILIVSFLAAALLVFRILTDISQSNVLRKQLIMAKEKAEELGRVKQRFLANMSHEIRTPLQSILGFAEQLKHQSTPNQDAVDAIYSSSEHLLHIVNEVLDFSKIESGKLLIERDTFNLIAVLHEVESAIRVQADKKNLEFILDLNEIWDIPLIGDAFRLRQILYNLLGNAIKFTLKGSVKLQVLMTDHEYGVNCVFKIIDTGLGMTESEIGHVFKQFEQAHATIDRQYGGTGLGLTIVKKLVEAQNGNLLVESTPGVGSMFTVELHFDKAPQDAMTTEKVLQPEQTQAVCGKVLVVDDDPMILRLCSLILDKYKIPHVTFEDALQVLKEPLDPDIKFVLLDIRLPGISGLELCRELRRKTSGEVKILALTAHVLPQEKNDLLDNGFDHVLTKPFREAELLSQLGVIPRAVSENNSNQKSSDLLILRQMTMGDDELFQAVLVQFLQETNEDLGELQEMMKHLNYPKIRELIHKLAGRIGQVGVEKLSEKLRKIEDDIVEGQRIEALADRIYGAIVEVQELVRQLSEEQATNTST